MKDDYEIETLRGTGRWRVRVAMAKVSRGDADAILKIISRREHARLVRYGRVLKLIWREPG